MFSYKTLEVYKKAYQANRTIYRFVKSEHTLPMFIKDQLGRASLSIVLSIAEGSAKFSNKDRRNFYVIARASAFECAALIDVLHDEGDLPASLFAETSQTYTDLSKLLFTMIKNLER